MLGAVYKQNNPIEFRNLYLVKEYFEQKSKTEEVWVAGGGLVNQLNGRLIWSCRRMVLCVWIIRRL